MPQEATGCSGKRRATSHPAARLGIYTHPACSGKDGNVIEKLKGLASKGAGYRTYGTALALVVLGVLTALGQAPEVPREVGEGALAAVLGLGLATLRAGIKGDAAKLLEAAAPAAPEPPKE